VRHRLGARGRREHGVADHDRDGQQRDGVTAIEEMTTRGGEHFVHGCFRQ
jgi:hypothetical protein